MADIVGDKFIIPDGWTIEELHFVNSKPYDWESSGDFSAEPAKEKLGNWLQRDLESSLNKRTILCPNGHHCECLGINIVYCRFCINKREFNKVYSLNQGSYYDLNKLEVLAAENRARNE